MVEFHMIHQNELILGLAFVAISADECLYATWANLIYRLRYWLCERIERHPYILVLLIVRDSEWLLLANKINHIYDELPLNSPIDWLHLIWRREIYRLRHLSLVDGRLRLVWGFHWLGFQEFTLYFFNLYRHIIESFFALNTSKD